MPNCPGLKSRQTRQRLLQAARLRFAANPYENVGMRAVADDAGVDAALVNRYFGGKEELFKAAIEGAFLLDEHLPTNLDTLGQHLVHVVMADVDELAHGSSIRRGCCSTRPVAQPPAS